MSMAGSHDTIIRYYRSLESRLVYALLRGEKHFGYFPEGQERIPIGVAQRNMIDKLGEVLRPEAGSFLLDAGCGEGSVALRLTDRFNVRVAGVDILDFNIASARQKAMRAGLADRVSFEVMDYANLSFPEGSFDGVYTMETLVHALDFRRALAEFRRVLRPGGRLVLFEYSVASPERLTPEQRRVIRTINEGSGMFSLSHFLNGSFPQILRDAGFVDVEEEDITPRVLPMYERVYGFLFLPYRLIRLLRLERRFINTTAVVGTYRDVLRQGIGRYNVVTAVKGS